MGGIDHTAAERLLTNLADSFDAPEISSLLTNGNVNVTIHLDTQDVATLLRLVSGEAIEKLPRLVYQPIPTYPAPTRPLYPYGPVWISKSNTTSVLDVDHNAKEKT